MAKLSARIFPTCQSDGLRSNSRFHRPTQRDTLRESLIMATGDHVENNTEAHRLKQAQFHHLLQQICTGDEKNMREVDYSFKDESDQERFPVSRCVHKYSKAKRVAVSRKSVRHTGAGSGGCRRSLAAGRTTDMANKENELTCADDVKTILSSDSSKMAGAGSKYEDYFSELMKDHEVMTRVLFGRNLRLNVALTLWRKNANELVAYLDRIQDPGVLVSCLPVLTKSLQDEQTRVSLGCCVDLFQQVGTILSTRYEEHLIVALHWVQSVVKRWWAELSSSHKRDGCSHDRNVQAMKALLLDLWQAKAHLISVPGAVGETARAIESYLSRIR